MRCSAQVERTNPLTVDNSSSLPIELRRHPLIARIRSNLLIRCGVKGGGEATSVVLGVSGGADSLALLAAMAAIRGNKGFGGLDLTAVYVDHGLRSDSAVDGDVVKAAATCLGVKFERASINLSLASGNRYAAARELRYRALAERAVVSGAQAVAVAHHAHDQLETVLMKLCRGTATGSASGMQWLRPLSEAPEPDIHLIRPLLNLRRDECEEICRAADLQWIDDPANHDLTRARARLRYQVVPVLEELWPGVAGRVAAGFDQVAEDADVARQRKTAPAQIGWAREEIGRGTEMQVRSVLRDAALVLTGGTAADALTRSHLDQAARAIISERTDPASFDWPCTLRLRISSKEVLLSRDP